MTSIIKNNAAFRNGVDVAADRFRQIVAQLDREFEDACKRLLATPDPTWPPHVVKLLDAMDRSSRDIFENVLHAMQDAEEIWGVEGQTYLDLMQAIIDDATKRQTEHRAYLAEMGIDPESSED